ncbi:uncharacterized protein Z518_03806 [Rhinocladiella mackenziei CBS 650.93]|uniref:Fungal lipase-type domain-containing protein n=1 Tax=Rhinocladiella mackenziei CBS 650.93 TaxID=1442369 RepID=A0A0D2H5Z2_9EURO|nr:uncharacterized protein Z518_03806 [Rhinocladiella mackenziei CBS 650.93]KIX05833.1 hypothetical protein Z518_03806 [Rhinocladiella mackenziei CBS 650.93]
MPFFSDARKRRKFAESPASFPPVYPSNPPPCAINTSTTVYQPQPAQSTPQADPYNGWPWHSYMASTVSLPPTRTMQNDYRPEPLQPQLTWSHTEPHLMYPQRPPEPASRVDWRTQIGDKFGDVISLIDEEAFPGSTRELEITIPESPSPDYPESYSANRDGTRSVTGNEKARPKPKRCGQEKQVNVFAKVDRYMNSRLPVSLPPLRVYIPTYPLLCLAAQYSASAYYSPQSASERKDFVSADGRSGAKAMVIKSIPCDDKKTVVFAIRGTSMFSIRDWAVNLNTEPVTPAGFLDDQGNLCHSGFLKVAKAMVKPIAARLRHLLEENPGRTACSLLITGHSAGGAVASLLYAHMLAETVQSELNILTGCFKRVHCVTFGSPPISLLPLQKPETADGRLRKCLFHSFINEGDPVVRAEKAYVRSLVDLLSSPMPSLAPERPTASPLTMLGASMSKLDLSLNPIKKPNPPKSKPPKLPTRKLWWEVPPATLSNAGRLVVLRVPDRGKEPDVTASIVKDEQLRRVIFGDPLAHSMDLYASRIETLAFRAVTGKSGVY